MGGTFRVVVLVQEERRLAAIGIARIITNVIRNKGAGVGIT